MSQAASGRKNRPWEGDDENRDDGWKQQHHQQDDRWEKSARTEFSRTQDPAPPPNHAEQSRNDPHHHIQYRPSHHHRHHHHQQRHPTYPPQTLENSASQPYREAASWTQVQPAVVSVAYTGPATALPSPRKEAHNQWSRSIRRSPPPSYLTPHREDNSQHFKRRRISDDEEESRQSEDGDIGRALTYRASPSHQGLLELPSSKYSQYPFLASGHAPPQAHQLLPPLPASRVSLQSSHQSAVPPPPHSIIDPWRMQHPYAPSTPHSSASYTLPKLTPRISSPLHPQGNSPPPPPSRPPPPPPPPGIAGNQPSASNSYPSDKLSTTYSNHNAAIIPDLENQYYRLSQENQCLRDELHKVTSGFTPGDSLRGIVAQLFEVVQDYAEVIAEQQQQVQTAVQGISGGGGGMGKDELPVPRCKGVSDQDLMAQESVVACLRGMHTTMKSKLNTLRRIGAMKIKVGLIEQSIAERVVTMSGDPTELLTDRYSLVSKANPLEQERLRLNARVDTVLRDKDDSPSKTSAASNSHGGQQPLPNSIQYISQPSSPHQQLPPTHTSTTAPASPSTVTIAPSTAPSTAAYNETLNALQRRLSVTQLEFETLQRDHERLRAALQRSQARAAALEKKHTVSSDENDTLTTERDRYQMLNETLEEQLTEVTASRDDYRRQAVAGGGQYSNILAMATRLEMKGVEDRMRWKGEKDTLTREKAELQRAVAEKERDIERLKAEAGELREEIGRLTEVATRSGGGGRTKDFLHELSRPSPPPSSGCPLSALPKAADDTDDVTHEARFELTNQHLRRQVYALENALAEMKREGMGILHAAQRLLATEDSVVD